MSDFSIKPIYEAHQKFSYEPSTKMSYKASHSLPISIKRLLLPGEYEHISGSIFRRKGSATRRFCVNNNEMIEIITDLEK